MSESEKKMREIALLMGVTPSQLTLVERRVAPGWDPAVGEWEETPAPAEEPEEEKQREKQRGE
jgi:hypothetical protein